MVMKHYPQQFKADAVALYRSRPGATIRSVAGDLGVNTETLRNWIRAAGERRPGSLSASGAAAPLPAGATARALTAPAKASTPATTHTALRTGHPPGAARLHRPGLTRPRPPPPDRRRTAAATGSTAGHTTPASRCPTPADRSPGRSGPPHPRNATPRRTTPNPRSKRCVSGCAPAGRRPPWPTGPRTGRGGRPHGRRVRRRVRPAVRRDQPVRDGLSSSPHGDAHRRAATAVVAPLIRRRVFDAWSRRPRHLAAESSTCSSYGDDIPPSSAARPAETPAADSAAQRPGANRIREITPVHTPGPALPSVRALGRPGVPPVATACGAACQPGAGTGRAGTGRTGRTGAGARWAAGREARARARPA